MIKNCSSKCSFSITKLIRNPKQTSKTQSHLTNCTKMSADMDIFPSLDYTDISEIVEKEKSTGCCSKVSFIIAKNCFSSQQGLGTKKRVQN